MKQHVAGHVKSGTIWKDPKDETPVELKARLVVERAAAKEKRKEMDSEIKAANLVLAKVGPALVALDAMLARPGMAMVASIIKDPLSAAAEAFRDFEETARNVVSSDGESRLDGVPDLKELCSRVAQGRKHLALATQMLSTLARVR
jgi:hypothetical protein